MILDEESKEIWKFTIAFIAGMFFITILDMWI